jgi:hypothetical protein
LARLSTDGKLVVLVPAGKCVLEKSSNLAHGVPTSPRYLTLFDSYLSVLSTAATTTATIRTKMEHFGMEKRMDLLGIESPILSLIVVVALQIPPWITIYTISEIR